MICWDTLSIHRVIFRRSLLNQSDPNNSAINHSIFLKSPTFVSPRHDHSRKIRKIPSRTKVFQLSSFPRSIKEWNKLPQLAVSTNDRTSKYPQKAFRDCGWIAILLWKIKYNLNLFFFKKPPWKIDPCLIYWSVAEKLQESCNYGRVEWITAVANTKVIMLS